MELNRFEMAAVKRTAQNVKTLRKNLSKVEEKIEELLVKKASVEKEIEMWEAPIIAKHGYSSEQILSGEADRIAEQTEYMDFCNPDTVDETPVFNEVEVNQEKESE